MSEEPAATQIDGVWQTNWNAVRKTRFADSGTPPEWPTTVKSISMDGLSLVGVDERTNELYWDGQKLVTERRFSAFERTLAVIALVITTIGVGAAVVQAWAAVASIH